ncbi:twin-arginine translocation signal domain-containing protein, partial [Rhizobiaceae sp. 2RAB30]
MVTRRNFLKLVGGGIVLAAAGGGVWAATRDPKKARMPWETAGRGESDPRRHALSYALLAPNPHNRQPWVADLGTADTVTLYCDLDRRLPHTDPFDRQITIGLGAFIELMAMAAAENGHRVDVGLFPEGEPQPRLDARPVARISFVKDAAITGDPLFRNVTARRSNKEPYETSRAVPVEALAAIAGVARSGRIAHVEEPAEVQKLRELAWAAMHVELVTPHTLKESVDVMRIGRAEIEANPDGIDLSGPLLEGLAITGLLSRKAMLDPTSSVFQQQETVVRPNFDTAMAFLWQATPGNSRTDQIAAGRDYVRLNLAATGLGLSMQPFSQALQEYPEMRSHFLQLRHELGIAEAETLQMFVRLGYGPNVKAAPR